MQIFELGERIATRTLRLEMDGTSVEVAVELGKPIPLENPDDGLVPYQFHGLGKEGIRYTIGIEVYTRFSLP